MSGLPKNARGFAPFPVKLSRLVLVDPLQLLQGGAVLRLASAVFARTAAKGRTQFERVTC